MVRKGKVQFQLLFLKGGALDRVRGLDAPRPYVDGFGQAVAPHQATQLRDAGNVREGKDRGGAGSLSARRPFKEARRMRADQGETSSPHRLTGGATDAAARGRDGMGVAGDAGERRRPRAAGDRRLATGWGMRDDSSAMGMGNGRAPDDGAARPMRAVAATLATPGRPRAHSNSLRLVLLHDPGADHRDDLRDDRVAEASQAVHPAGNPMSHSTHVGFSAPPAATGRHG